MNETRISVLIVDDQPRRARATARTVSDPAIRVSCAFSSEEALDLMAVRRVDVVVAAHTNGIELLSRVRSHHPRTIRILLARAADGGGHAEANRVYEPPLDDELLRTAILELSGPSVVSGAPSSSAHAVSLAAPSSVAAARAQTQRP